MLTGYSHGWGKMCYYDGYEYIGEWEKSKRQGHGTLYCPDGKIKSGYFEQDRFYG